MDEGKNIIITVTQNIQGGVQAGGAVTGVDIGQLSAVLGSQAAQVAERRVPLVPAPRRLEEVALVGREDVLQEAIDRLSRGGKFYFHGAFGVGKTALASELFNRLVREHAPPGGYLWGSVAEMDVEDILEWIAGALQEEAVSQATGRGAKINLLRQILSQRKGLLLGLDDVRDEAVSRALLEAAGDCALILNGDRPLETGGLALAIGLGPLKQGEARQLFTSLAYPAGTKPSDAELERIGQIVDRLGCLPLAVRLAARQRRQGVSLERLLKMLDTAPGVLLSSEECLKLYLDNRRQELEGMPAALQLLARLASFPAHHASIDALATGLPAEVEFEAENFLVERGLVERREGDRLQLHALLALWFQNAQPAVVQAEFKAVEDWLVEFVNQHRDDLNYDAFEMEQANLLGLLDRFQRQGRWDDLVALFRNLFNYLRARGMWGTNLQTLEAALAHAGDMQNPFYNGWSYLHRGIMHTLRGETKAAEADLDQADQIFTQLGETYYRGKTLYRRAAITHMAGNLDLAAAQLEQSLAWMSDRASTYDRAGAHERLAGIYAVQGRMADAEAHYQAAISLGDPEVQARAHIELGSLARQSGDFAQAQAHYARALRLAEQLGHVLQRAALSQELGYLYYQQGSYDLAGASFDAARQVYEELDFPLGLAHIQHALGNLAFARQDLEGARLRYQAALDLNQAHSVDTRESTLSAAYNRYMLGVVDHRQGRLDQAAETYARVLQEAQQMEDRGLQASTLYQSAVLDFERGDRPAAARLLEQAQALSRQIQNRQTEASGLALLGSLQAQEGHLETARQTLASAHALFAAFNAVDSGKVALIDSLG